MIRPAREAEHLSKKTTKAVKSRPHAGLLTKVVILVTLVVFGLHLRNLQAQVENAQAERDRYAAQVETTQQENDALESDIAEGATPEKMEELARDNGYVMPDEYVFYDTSN